MSRSIRTLLSVSILAGVIGWIVLSYLPSTVVTLPQFQWTPNGIVRFFPGVIVAGVGLFVLLQVWLVWTTGASVRQYEKASEVSGIGEFSLSVRREVILTAVPIAFTVGVAIASYGWWQRLAALH